MKKKKEQVKYLKKTFGAVIKAFEKEKNKKKRKQAFDFLTGRITEFQQFAEEAASAPVADAAAAQQEEIQHVNNLIPSAHLVDELRAGNQHRQD